MRGNIYRKCGENWSVYVINTVIDQKFPSNKPPFYKVDGMVIKYDAKILIIIRYYIYFKNIYYHLFLFCNNSDQNTNPQFLLELLVSCCLFNNNLQLIKTVKNKLQYVILQQCSVFYDVSPLYRVKRDYTYSDACILI